MGLYIHNGNSLPVELAQKFNTQSVA